MQSSDWSEKEDHEPEIVVSPPPEVIELDHDCVEGEQVVATELLGLEK